MHLQPKSVDTSQNVMDIHKARNANELITVVARINTALRLYQHNYKVSVEAEGASLNKACSMLTDVLQVQQELQAAFAASSTLNDAKRDRCVTAISNLNSETLSLKRQLMTLINRESKQTVSDKLDKYVNIVHDLLRPNSAKIYMMAMYDGTTSYMVVIAKQVHLSSGFISPEVCVKLAENADGFKVCLPDSTFVDAEWTWFTSSRQLKEYLVQSLDYNVKPTTVRTSKIPHLEGIVGVDVTDTLNVRFDRVVKASEINAALKAIIPIVKKAVGANSYEVLHRVSTENEGKVLQLALGSKRVVDTASLNRLYRVLKLQRHVAAAANALMEKK